MINVLALPKAPNIYRGGWYYPLLQAVRADLREFLSIPIGKSGKLPHLVWLARRCAEELGIPVPVEVQPVEEYLGLSALQYRLSAEMRERGRQVRIKQARERETARKMFKHGASAATVASKLGISKQTAAAYKRGLVKS